MITKRNGKYIARVFYYENGKKHSISKTFPVKSAATKFQAEYEYKKTLPEPIKSTDQLFTDYFNSWFKTFKEPSISPATRLRYHETYQVLLSYFNGVKLANMNRERYQQFINDYGANHAKATVQKAHSQTRAAVKDAYADGKIKRDFTNGITVIGQAGKDEEMKFLNIGDMILLLEDMKRDFKVSATSHAMIVTSLLTGMRLAEVAALQEENFYPKFNRIQVVNSWNYLAKEHYADVGMHKEVDFKPTKNKQSQRTIDISPELTAYLSMVIKMQHQINKSPNPYKLLFLNNRGEVPTSNAVNKVLRHAFTRLGITNQITFHGLRHTHASFLLAKGIKIEYISRRLGHASIETTLRVYSHLMKETHDAEASKAVDVLSQIKPKSNDSRNVLRINDN